MLLIRVIFVVIFFNLLNISPSSANCSIGLELELSNKYQNIFINSLPSRGSPTIPLMNGTYKVVDKKNIFVKVKNSNGLTGWLPENYLFLDGSGKTLGAICYEYSDFKYKSENDQSSKSFPIKYDTSSIFALNSEIGNNFYIVNDVTNDVENEASDYERKLLNKAYFIAITDFYSNNLNFASYGMILNSDNSPILDSEIEGAFEGIERDFNISLPTNTTEFTDDQIDYHFKEFKYYQKDVWEWLTDSKDVDYFNYFNNCFTAVLNDKPRNGKSITFFMQFTSCHKNKLTKKEIGNILKSIHIKNYKTPTVFYDYVFGSSVKKYQVNNKNEQPSKMSVDLQLELDDKLPNWHFNKNDDYYILGFDKLGNKLIGSAKFKDPYVQKPQSFGDYYILRDTYEDTLTKSCSFESTANTNYMKSGTLVAKGNVILNCNGEKKYGRWEQKGSIGYFVTNDKSIYGFFRKGKFDYLGTYLLPNNIYDQNIADTIYENVRSWSFEDPWVYYSQISPKIANASKQYYANQSNTDKNYIASKQEKQIDNISKNSDSSYIYCINKNDIVVRYSGKMKKACPTGSNKTSELAWINNQSQIDNKINNKSNVANLNILFDTSEIKFVNATPLNIRETPNGKWHSIINKGEKVAVLEVNEDKSWTRIISKDGDRGWVSSEYLVDNLSDTQKDVQDKSSKDSLIVHNESLNEKPEIIVPKIKFDNEYPIISCVENEIFTNQKTALINCKITDNDEVYKVFINGNEVNLRASKIKEEFPVVIGNSKLELQAFDMSGNETKEFISVEREFNLATNIKKYDPLRPGLISAPTNKNRIAIIIGIKDYKDIPDTKYGDKDAFTFIDYANETLGISNSNINYFIDDKAGFLDFKTIEKWLSTKVNKDTEVFFFYSGHGANNNGQSLLLPSDFRTDLIDDSSVTKESFLQKIAEQNPKHIFAFFDACFSGLSREGETLIAGLRNISIVEEEAPFSNITIFNSASGAEFSSDFDEVGHGLFSYYLMKGLEGEADNNSDQQISTSELYNYIYANVSEQSINLGPQQNPSLITNDDQIIVKW